MKSLDIILPDILPIPVCLYGLYHSALNLYACITSLPYLIEAMMCNWAYPEEIA